MNTKEPVQIIILGGAGDLAQRKLLPALFALYVNKLLPAAFEIVGLARTARSDDEYQSLAKDAILKQNIASDEVQLDTFCEKMRYVSGSFNERESYNRLSSALAQFEVKTKDRANRVFYLAVPPMHYDSIFHHLHESKLAQPHEDRFARILVEKPFGNDYASAIALDASLSALFAEDQIFRIDHYLAKEAVQNILSFRFANTLLRSVWNREYIKDVHITMHETINAESRGAFYDTVGALRDVGQNHLLQILALVAMDEPYSFTAEHIREKRAAVLRALRPVAHDSASSCVVRAQYEGYKTTKGVDDNSDTETYFEFKTFVDNPSWQDVPFYISAGKALKNDEVAVRIDFKEVADGPFATQGNAIILTVSPVQSMNMTLNVKRPGHGYHIESDTLSFAWNEENRGIVNAYEKVLLDCIEGDQTLFTKTDEVLASWKFISSITDVWGDVPLQTYEQGSQGPEFSLCND